MAKAAPDSDHAWLSLVGNLIDGLFIPAVAAVENGTVTQSQLRHETASAQPAIRWQSRFLVTSQNFRERLTRVNGRLERMPVHRREASAARLRAILVSESPVAGPKNPVARAPKSAQRFVAFLMTEMQRAAGASLEDAIGMTSTVSGMTPGFGFIGASTLRSWYNKSGADYRGLKQVASWLVANWKRLAYGIIKNVLDGVSPSYRIAEAWPKMVSSTTTSSQL